MATSSKSVIFRLYDLPTELILEIITWAQQIWRAEAFSAHDPYVGVKRHFTSALRFPARPENCCRGSDYKTVPRCLSVAPTVVARSPAHLMSQVGSALRELLLREKRIWKSDNTFYRVIAERAGFMRVAGVPNAWGGDFVIAYEARSFIAPHVCSCLVPALQTFFPSLEKVKMALPWGSGDDPSRAVEDDILLGHNPAGSPLRHFDLELYHSPLADIEPRVKGIECAVLRTARFANASRFFYSKVLTSLYLQYPLDRHPRFGIEFSAALVVCGASLEFLTIDACGGSFTPAGDVMLPKLRFFRLATHVTQAVTFLRRLALPPTVDIHLEPVVSWRRANTGISSSTEPRCEWRTDDIHGLWRYSAALAYPDQMRTIFRDPTSIRRKPEDLWQRMDTVALDIRLDPSTSATERACARFPEFVGLSFTTSVQEMKTLLAGSGLDWRRCEPPEGKVHARRSLGIRDGSFSRRSRDSMYNPDLVKPVYDVVQYIIKRVIADRPGTTFTGYPRIYHLVIHPDSFIPAFSLGWASILGLLSDLQSLVVLCAGLPPQVQFTDNAEGSLDIAHIDALARYLNEADGGDYPCPGLERIEIPFYRPELEGDRTVKGRLEAQLNSRERVQAVSRRIDILL